jgi:hypothetical protein
MIINEQSSWHTISYKVVPSYDSERNLDGKHWTHPNLHSHANITRLVELNDRKITNYAGRYFNMI